MTSDAEFSECCRLARNYGQKNRYEHETYGLNSRLDELQAALLSAELPLLDRNNAKRGKIAEIYRKELASVKQINLPLQRKGADHAYHLFVIEAADRSKLQEFLKEKGIATLIHYPIPLHKQKCFKEYNLISLPATERAAANILSLPTDPSLSAAEIRYITGAIKEFYGI